MGHTDRECGVFIFGDRWPGYCGSECQVPSRRISALISYFQAFPPATVIFTGICVLLSVGVLHPSLVRPILTSRGLRRPKMRVLAETSLLRCLTASNGSSTGLRYTPASHRLWQ